VQEFGRTTLVKDGRLDRLPSAACIVRPRFSLKLASEIAISRRVPSMRAVQRFHVSWRTILSAIPAIRKSTTFRRCSSSRGYDTSPTATRYATASRKRTIHVSGPLRQRPGKCKNRIANRLSAPMPNQRAGLQAPLHGIADEPAESIESIALATSTISCTGAIFFADGSRVRIMRMRRADRVVPVEPRPAAVVVPQARDHFLRGVRASPVSTIAYNSQRNARERELPSSPNTQENGNTVSCRQFFASCVAGPTDGWFSDHQLQPETRFTMI